MDILDIILAKQLSPSAQSDAAVSQAQTAAKEAKQAAKEATDAVKDIAEVVIEETNTDTVNTTEISVKKNGKTKKAAIKQYKQAGDNEDGTMTQKAIKEYVNSKAVESGSNFGEENAGSVVVIGEDGGLTSGDVTESSIIRTQILTGSYQPKEALGIEIDYENRTVKRIQDSEDFNQYSIYGGINRCLVDDSGEIVSFYGDDIYMDNFSTGYQTMVYIPKFYYIRVPIGLSGATIKKEIIMVSGIKQAGFKVHPAFVRDDEELDYVLYSAYEGSTFDVSANAYNRIDGEIDFAADKLASITNAKPTSGVRNDLTIENAEKLAKNRGDGWHITDIKIESALQMLSIVEFGSLNSQKSLGLGVSYITGALGSNCSSYTGSTASMGNVSGSAAETINEVDGVEKTYTDNGYVAVSYRGIENPWGNLRRFVNGIQINGAGLNAGVPYILDGEDYVALNFTLPAVSDWISNFGYANENYDWLFIPVKAEGANSNVPVGDYVDVSSKLNGMNIVALGGHWGFKENDGIFNYSFDRAPTFASRAYGARLMYIPKKNAIYEDNIAAWKASIGG